MADITFILGYFNAKVGQGKIPNMVDDYGLGTRNEREDANIIRNHIDYIVINIRYKLSKFCTN